jgi:hypothetical protein
MGWLSKFFKPESKIANTPEDVVRFYQQLGFFVGADPAAVIEEYTARHGTPPKAGNRWDDVFLLACADGEVWSEDPEADVCAENAVYSEVLPEWSRISHGAFVPTGLSEHWESDHGPITLSFELDGWHAIVSPNYLNDWIDLDVLQKINQLIADSNRRFESAVDGNFALVLCLTPEQKSAMQTLRQFPFAW